MLQQVAVSVDIFYRRFAVRDVIAEGTIAVWKRLVEGDSIGSVIFTQIALSVAFPKIILRAHAASMILLTFLGSPNVRIEGTILLLGDRGECDLEGILRVTKWKVTLVVIVFLIHNSTPLDLLKSAGADLCP